MNIRYVIYRLIRRVIPPKAVDFFLRKNFLLKISMGTTDPMQVVREYEAELSRLGRSFVGKTVLEFGYGGSFGSAVEFLNAGAAHVFLYDKFAKPNNEANRALAKFGSEYFFEKNGQVFPNPKFITLLDDPRVPELPGVRRIDFIFSRAVLEHVDDPAGIIYGLSHLMAEGGMQVHLIDLRDHYFRFPYEMLCYSDLVWKYFLDPAENLNRLRLLDFMEIFKKIYSDVSYRIIDADLENFRRSKSRIKSRFLSGDDGLDAAQRVWITAL